jgi:hypothetical protein
MDEHPNLPIACLLYSGFLHSRERLCPTVIKIQQPQAASHGSCPHGNDG